MSEFDREAERERLREKYERDQEKRETTQRMSELLLQGATMLNVHCDECGDPVFRYEGQEFCPTCQRAVDAEGAVAADEGTAAGGEQADGADAADAAGAAVDPDDPSVDATPDATSADNGAVRPGRSGGASDGPTPSDRSPTPASPSRASPAGNGAAADDGTDAPHEPPEGATGEAGGRTETAGGDGRTDARAALERSLARFAERAERTDDPREARDLIAAAREAAEALAALDGRRDAR